MFFLIILASRFSYSSYVRTTTGEYSNNQVSFKISSMSVYNVRPRKRVWHSVTFYIKAQAGYKIMNNSFVKFGRNIMLKFKGESKGKYYKNGSVRKGRYLFMGGKVTLVYFVCKNKDDVCIRKEINFRVMHDFKYSSGRIQKFVLKKI